MGNIIAVHQRNDEYWNDPKNPTILGKFIEDTLKNDAKMKSKTRLLERASCLGQVGRSDDHAGLKVSIANMDIADNISDLPGPPKRLTDWSAGNETSTTLNAKADPDNLFLRTDDLRTDDDTTNATFGSLWTEELFIGKRPEYFNQDEINRRKSHDLNNSNTALYSAQFDAAISIIGSNPLISEKFIEANKLKTRDDNLDNIDSVTKMAKMPEAFHPHGFIVKKVSFKDDTPKTNYDINTNKGNCDTFYENFAKEKLITHLMMVHVV